MAKQHVGQRMLHPTLVPYCIPIGGYIRLMSMLDVIYIKEIEKAIRMMEIYFEQILFILFFFIKFHRSRNTKTQNNFNELKKLGLILDYQL